MRRQGFLSALVAAVTMVMPSSGGSLAAGPDPGQAVSVSSVSSLKAAATGRYWSPARMQAAKPMPTATIQRRGPVAASHPRVGTHPGRVESSSPSGGGGGIYNGDPVGANYDYPFPFTRRTLEKQLQKVFPYRTVGVVFMRQDHVDYVCSGSSVQSSPRQVVYTAGHCLDDGAGHPSSHVVFVPAYRNGSVPYGAFPATRLFVMAAWKAGGDSAFDQGAFSVGRNSRNKTLQSQVGALGFAWNQSRIQHWDLIGYPADYPFSGEKAVVCEASHAFDDTPAYANDDPAPGYDTMGVGCDMTGGSSGGPWIVSLGRGNYLNGVVSYGYSNQSKAIYGPYFGVESNHLRCAAATGHASATSC